MFETLIGDYIRCDISVSVSFNIPSNVNSCLFCAITSNKEEDDQFMCCLN